MKLTNKMVEGYLSDCLGYDEMMIDELKDLGVSLPLMILVLATRL